MQKSGVSGFSRYTPDSIRVSLAKREESRLECIFYFIYLPMESNVSKVLFKVVISLAAAL